MLSGISELCLLVLQRCMSQNNPLECCVADSNFAHIYGSQPGAACPSIEDALVDARCTAQLLSMEFLQKQSIYRSSTCQKGGALGTKSFIPVLPSGHRNAQCIEQKPWR